MTQAKFGKLFWRNSFEHIAFVIWPNLRLDRAGAIDHIHHFRRDRLAELHSCKKNLLPSIRRDLSQKRTLRDISHPADSPFPWLPSSTRACRSWWSRRFRGRAVPGRCGGRNLLPHTKIFRTQKASVKRKHEASCTPPLASNLARPGSTFEDGNRSDNAWRKWLLSLVEART